MRASFASLLALERLPIAPRARARDSFAVQVIRETACIAATETREHRSRKYHRKVSACFRCYPPKPHQSSGITPCTKASTHSFIVWRCRLITGSTEPEASRL